MQLFLWVPDESDSLLDSNCSTDGAGMCGSTLVYVGNVVLTPMICLTGIIFNMINLFIFTRNIFQMKDSFLVCLVSLAFADLMTLIFALPGGLIRCFPQSDTTIQYVMNIYEVYIFLPITNMFGTSSVWITLGVATERYIQVGHPHVAKVLCDKTHAIFAIVITFVLAIIFNFPIFFSRRVTYEGIQTTDFGKGSGYLDYLWTRMFIAKIIPVMCVAFVNSLLIQSVWVQKSRSQSLVFPAAKRVRRQQSQNKITAMLLSITGVFIVCNILEPFAHLQICPHVFGLCASVDGTCDIVSVIANNLESIAFASNFVSYCIFNNQFVQVLQGRICCKNILTIDTSSATNSLRGNMLTTSTKNQRKPLSTIFSSNHLPSSKFY